ncbi:MAG: polyamine ABC transporter ATP-binding protein [Candidatus Rokuibacteriota bacterium]|nr:MAG: polyamine ABC transporter ATP-binding protein [Candidatus Rokubacteria bacterium]
MAIVTADAPRREGARLRLEHVSKHFIREGQSAMAAVNDVSLTVEPGELLTLLGPSGCGKTTTLRMLAGFEQPDAGRVYVGDQDVTELMVYRRSIGFVFQNYALFPHLTVFENVAYGLRVRRLADAAIRARVGRVLDLVGLPGYERRFPNQLSGGEQQRVAVARAVVVEPQLLLFDEPLSNLDAKLRVQMRAELSRLQRQLAITTVYVTHDQEEAMAISDRIAVMRQGTIAQVGTAEELYRAPRSAFVAQFIGRVNLVESRVLAVTNGHVAVDLWGASLSVPADDTYATGQRLFLVLRPESLTLVADSAKAAEGEVVVTGVVRSRTFLGEKVEYAVEVNGALLQALTYDPTRRGVLEVGARVGVSCHAASVRPLVAEPRA